MDVNGQLIGAVAFLFTLYSGLGAAVIKYLLGEVRELKDDLTEANTATAAANAANAKMAALVPDLYAEIAALRSGTGGRR